MGRKVGEPGTTDRWAATPESSGYDGIGGGKHTFWELGREKLGVLLAAVTADFCTQLDHIGMGVDVGPQGLVYRKWHDSCFMPTVPQSREEPKAEEIATLVQALDEFRAGRILELGDTLATRLRMVAYGVEKNTWSVAKQF